MLESPQFFLIVQTRFPFSGGFASKLSYDLIRKHLKAISHAASLATNQVERFVQRHTPICDLFWTVAPGCLPF
jgi:hypothetical protein